MDSKQEKSEMLNKKVARTFRMMCNSRSVTQGPGVCKEVRVWVRVRDSEVNGME